MIIPKDDAWLPGEEIVPIQVFKAEVIAWAKRIGVEPRKIHLRPMRHKWASCSTKGRLSFDTDLLSQLASFRAEVIVHELLHLKVPNHGKLFKALLKAYLGVQAVHTSNHLGLGCAAPLLASAEARVPNGAHYE